METISEKTISPGIIEITAKWQIEKSYYLSQKKRIEDSLARKELMYNNSIIKDQQRLVEINETLAKFE